MQERGVAGVVGRHETYLPPAYRPFPLLFSLQFFPASDSLDCTICAICLSFHHIIFENHQLAVLPRNLPVPLLLLLRPIFPLQFHHPRSTVLPLSHRLKSHQTSADGLYARA